jgi:hypothetical protein
MELRTEARLIKMTITEKAILKERAAEKGITISQLIFNALKIKRSKRVKPRTVNNNITQNAA